ncbi:unnamed protein product, partial [Tilletia controversa]
MNAPQYSQQMAALDSIDPDLLLTHPAVMARMAELQQQSAAVPQASPLPPPPSQLVPPPPLQLFQAPPHPPFQPVPMTPSVSSVSASSALTSSSDPTHTPAYIAARSQDPRTMVWTREIAKEKAKLRKKDDRYSKDDVMRDQTGNELGSERIATIETVTRLACAAIDEHDFDPPIAPQDRTFRRLKSASLELLVRIAKKLEGQCPELSYCDHHFKA